MVADTPENYAKFPGPMKFIRDVPTDWQETRVLNGEIGDYVTIARKERGGEGWYIGAVGDEQERSVSFKLDFLTPGKSYVAEIYRDGDDADYRTEKRHSIVIEDKVLTSADSLTMRIAPGGGFAIRLVEAKRK
jgi:alpha-glucosidase